MFKNLHIIILAFISITVNAQTSNHISYQAIVRSQNNQLVADSDIGMKISILHKSTSGNAIYAESHKLKTNENGLIYAEIGKGALESGSFSDINWEDGPFFIKTETDPEGGANYTVVGVNQILSVPMANYASKAGSVNETDPVYAQSPAKGINAENIENWNTQVQNITITEAGNIGIGTTTPEAKFEVNGDIIRTIAYASGNGPVDQTDNGQIKSRVLTVTKKKDNTKLRVTYIDNLRVTGGNKACMWYLKVNGNPLNSPVNWMFFQSSGNHHTPTTNIGYVEGVSSGIHEIQVWVAPAPDYSGCDCYTGWNNSSWVLEAEEVN